MRREKIEMKKIEKVGARQVTFSKRRRGLFKKAQELSVLCDADVALIIFSFSGKIFDYASSSMKEILEKYNVHPKNLNKLQPYSIEDVTQSNLTQQVAERSHELRRLRGEELQGLSIQELHTLQNSLELGLTRVIQKKDEKISKQINLLQEKGLRLMEINQRLRQQVVDESSLINDSDTSLKLGLPSYTG